MVTKLLAIYRKTDLQVRLKLVSMIGLKGTSDKFPLERSNQEHRLPFQLFCFYTQKILSIYFQTRFSRNFWLMVKKPKVQNKNVDKTKWVRYTVCMMSTSVCPLFMFNWPMGKGFSGSWEGCNSVAFAVLERSPLKSLKTRVEIQTGRWDSGRVLCQVGNYLLWGTCTNSLAILISTFTQ